MKQWVCLPFWFSNIWFILFLWTCKLLPLYTVFSGTINIWEFFAPCFSTQVGLQFSTICSNMSTNINMNFHTLGDRLISYNSMLNQIFISETGRKKRFIVFNCYDFTNDEDWEAQILRSASSWSQLQDLTVKSTRKWLKK
jgi:hypothetical protein